MQVPEQFCEKGKEEKRRERKKEKNKTKGMPGTQGVTPCLPVPAWKSPSISSARTGCWKGHMDTAVPVPYKYIQ